MATIAKFNDIFTNRGVDAATAYATASGESRLLWAAGLAKNGRWDPNHKPSTPTTASKPVRTESVRQPGKTEREATKRARHAKNAEDRKV